MLVVRGSLDDDHGGRHLPWSSSCHRHVVAICLLCAAVAPSAAKRNTTSSNEHDPQLPTSIERGGVRSPHDATERQGSMSTEEKGDGGSVGGRRAPAQCSKKSPRPLPASRLQCLEAVCGPGIPATVLSAVLHASDECMMCLRLCDTLPARATHACAAVCAPGHLGYGCRAQSHRQPLSLTNTARRLAVLLVGTPSLVERDGTVRGGQTS
jgi:hypothetical protein